MHRFPINVILAAMKEYWRCNVYCFVCFYMPYDVSQSTTALSAACTRCRPPSSLVSGQESMICDIVWMSPQNRGLRRPKHSGRRRSYRSWSAAAAAAFGDLRPSYTIVRLRVWYIFYLSRQYNTIYLDLTYGRTMVNQDRHINLLNKLVKRLMASWPNVNE